MLLSVPLRWNLHRPTLGRLWAQGASPFAPGIGVSTFPTRDTGVHAKEYPRWRSLSATDLTSTLSYCSHLRRRTRVSGPLPVHLAHKESEEPRGSGASLWPCPQVLLFLAARSCRVDDCVPQALPAIVSESEWEALKVGSQYLTQPHPSCPLPSP